MTLNDAMLAATGGPTVNDGLRAYWSQVVPNPETLTLDDLQHAWLRIQMPVAPQTTLNDLWMEYLTGVEGLSGTMSDMELQYWISVIP